MTCTGKNATSAIGVLVSAFCLSTPACMSRKDTRGPEAIDAAVVDGEVARWVRAQPDLVAVWDALGFARELLTLETRRCLDSADDLFGAPSDAEIGHKANEPYLVSGRIIDGASLRRCAQIGEEEIRTNRMEKRQRDLEGHLSDGTQRWLGAVLGYRMILAENANDKARTEIATHRRNVRNNGPRERASIRRFRQQIQMENGVIARLTQRAKDNQVDILDRKDARIRRVQDCVDAAYDHDLRDSITESDINAVVSAAPSFAVEGQDCLWILIFLREITRE